jgi:carbamoyl-phosphate synthase large subunit
VKVPAARREILVLDGHSRAATAIVRSLGRSGFKVTVGGTAPCVSAASKYASQALVLPDPDVSDHCAYAAAILDHLGRTHTDAVLASTDASLEVLLHHRKAFEAHSIVGAPSPRAARAAVDKTETLRVAEEQGLPIPRSEVVDSERAAQSAADAIGYPCVIKPATSWDVSRGRRVASTLVHNASEAAAATGRLVGESTMAAVVQEYITDGREAVTLVRSKQGYLAEFAMAASRTWPVLGGNSVMRCSIPVPKDTGRYSQALLEAIGYYGYAEVEWRRDKQGTPRLMEINARFSQSVELSMRAGLDLPSLYTKWLLGDHVTPVSEYALGTRLSWLHGEIHLLVASVRGYNDVNFRQQIMRMASDYFPPPYIDGLAFDDLRPSLRHARTEIPRMLDHWIRRRASNDDLA